MLHIAHAARCNHRDIQRFAHGASERQIEADFGAVSIHAGEQNLARAARLHIERPFHRINAGGLAPAVGKHFPARVFGVDCFGVDRHHNRLRAEKAAGFVD